MALPINIPGSAHHSHHSTAPSSPLLTPTDDLPCNILAKRIYLVRHAQAEHNVFSDWMILDPALTKVGRKQSHKLHQHTRDIQRRAQLLVTSPLRRTMETALIGFPDLKTRLEAEGKPVVLLDIAQEVGDVPCDTPLSPVEYLASSNDGMFQEAGLDFSGLSPEYASKQGIYHPDRVEERAKLVRHWLRNRPEQEIVLVAHGDILRYMVDGHHSTRHWNNATVGEFGFASSSDADALLVQRGELWPEPGAPPPSY